MWNWVPLLQLYLIMGEFKVQIMGGNKLKVLDLINRFGVIANKQIFRYFDGEITPHAIYKILADLEGMGFIAKGNIGRIFYAYIRPSASSVVTEPMYRFNKLNLSELLHDLRVNYYLIERYKQAKESGKFRSVSFITERELIDEILIEREDKITDSNYTRQIDKLKRHLSDGILIVETFDGRVNRTAIEYELTQKAKGTYEKILRKYQLSSDRNDLDSVIYIVKGKRIQRKIEQVMSENNYSFNIRFYDADETFE